jgi:hypothetical protein
MVDALRSQARVKVFVEGNKTFLELL